MAQGMGVVQRHVGIKALVHVGLWIGVVVGVVRQCVGMKALVHVGLWMQALVGVVGQCVAVVGPCWLAVWRMGLTVAVISSVGRVLKQGQGKRNQTRRRAPAVAGVEQNGEKYYQTTDQRIFFCT